MVLVVHCHTSTSQLQQYRAKIARTKSSSREMICTARFSRRSISFLACQSVSTVCGSTQHSNGGGATVARQRRPAMMNLLFLRQHATRQQTRSERTFRSSTSCSDAKLLTHCYRRRFVGENEGLLRSARCATYCVTGRSQEGVLSGVYDVDNVVQACAWRTNEQLSTLRAMLTL